MTAPTPNAETIRALLIGFDWSNYGLDLMEDAEPDWADDLADRIVATLAAPPAPTPNAELAYTWLDVATAAFGEPRIAFPEPIRTGRRCWAWFIDGHNFHVAIDIENGRRRTWAGSPGRTAELRTAEDPSDADVCALLAFAWPGFAAAAEAFGPRPESVDEQAWRECAHRADYTSPAHHERECAYHRGEVDENGLPVDDVPPNAGSATC